MGWRFRPPGEGSGDGTNLERVYLIHADYLSAKIVEVAYSNSVDKLSAASGQYRIGYTEVGEIGG